MNKNARLIIMISGGAANISVIRIWILITAILTQSHYSHLYKPCNNF